MSKDQRVDDGRLEAEHVKLDYRDSTDDEEVRLLPHRRGMDEPDPPGSDIRDGPNTSDTQRDEALLKTEPLQGARPKWNIGERPPVDTVMVSLDCYVRLVLRSWGESRPGRPDVLRDGCDRCVWWRHPLGTFRSSRFRILRRSRGRWSSTVVATVASVATSVSGSEWYWPVVGSASGGVGQCGSASQ